MEKDIQTPPTLPTKTQDRMAPVTVLDKKPAIIAQKELAAVGENSNAVVAATQPPADLLVHVDLPPIPEPTTRMDLENLNRPHILERSPVSNPAMPKEGKHSRQTKLKPTVEKVHKHGHANSHDKHQEKHTRSDKDKIVVKARHGKKRKHVSDDDDDESNDLIDDSDVEMLDTPPVPKVQKIVHVTHSTMDTANKDTLGTAIPALSTVQLPIATPTPNSQAKSSTAPAAAASALATPLLLVPTPQNQSKPTIIPQPRMDNIQKMLIKLVVNESERHAKMLEVILKTRSVDADKERVTREECFFHNRFTIQIEQLRIMLYDPECDSDQEALPHRLHIPRVILPATPVPRAFSSFTSTTTTLAPTPGPASAIAKH